MRLLSLVSLSVAAALGIAQFSGCASSPNERMAGQVLDDSVVTAKVKKELFHQKGVSMADVNVTTYNGVVQLSGFVPNADAVRLAEEAARRVEGVRSVENDIRIAPSS
jgi:hyperosmotically inducible protein